MARHGKTIKIFLKDCDPSGRWVCELSQWSGKGFKIPRTSYKKCESMKELRAPSIYFLLGSDADTDKQCIYIGETEDAVKRMYQHMQEEKMDWFVEEIVFISKDDNLNKAHIKYLENRFYEIAIATDRYKVMNANVPKKSSLSESEEAEMEEFIDNVKLVVAALGHKVFEPLIPVADEVVASNENYLYLTYKKEVLATGLVVPDGFVVLKGSKLSENELAKSCPEGAVKLRVKYLSDGTVVDNAFTKDTYFTSPSAAADFICGYSVNGLNAWKNKEGKPLKKINEVSINKK